MNRPGAAGQQTLSCASGQRICCYDDHPEVRTKTTTKNILNYWPYDNYCLVRRTLTTTSACSSGTQVAASRSHPPLLSTLMVDGSRSGQTLVAKLVSCCSFMSCRYHNIILLSNVVFRAAVRLQFMETSNAGREPTEDQ